MDNELWNEMNNKYRSHWAGYLVSGDRVKATIRHPNDGSLNRHGVEIIVVEVLSDYIMGSDNGNVIKIPFNELTKI